MRLLSIYNYCFLISPPESLQNRSKISRITTILEELLTYFETYKIDVTYC